MHTDSQLRRAGPSKTASFDHHGFTCRRSNGSGPPDDHTFVTPAYGLHPRPPTGNVTLDIAPPPRDLVGRGMYYDPPRLTQVVDPSALSANSDVAHRPWSYLPMPTYSGVGR